MPWYVGVKDDEIFLMSSAGMKAGDVFYLSDQPGAAVNVIAPVTEIGMARAQHLCDIHNAYEQAMEATLAANVANAADETPIATTPRPPEAEIQAALANVYGYLTRAQDADWERVAPYGQRLTVADMQDPTKNEYEPENVDDVMMDGIFDMRMIVIHALEGAAGSLDEKAPAACATRAR